MPLQLIFTLCIIITSTAACVIELYLNCICSYTNSKQGNTVEIRMAMDNINLEVFNYAEKKKDITTIPACCIIWKILANKSKHRQKNKKSQYGAPRGNRNQRPAV